MDYTLPQKAWVRDVATGMEERPVLYLIDGHALAYRSYFALQRGGFTTSKGESTSAVFGFSRTLLDVYDHYQPKYLAVAFDEGLSAREEIYPEYKATREKMPTICARNCSAYASW